MNQTLLNRTWLEIDLDAIAANVRRTRAGIRRGCEIMGVVKADAYGHGVYEAATAMLEAGVNRLAVSLLDEAIELRRAGISAPILVLGYSDPRRAAEILAAAVTQTVFSRDLAEALSAAAVAAGSVCRIHIKVDTGMGRVGFLAGYQAIKEIDGIRRLPGIAIEGLYSHFASADEPDDAYTRRQFEQFLSICRELDRIGLAIPLRHICNSAALMRFPEMHLDMVRPGLMLYGMTPPGCPDAWNDLRPAMTMKTNLVLTKIVPAGSAISYGRRFVTNRESLIGTIPVGYADGFLRQLSDRAEVLVRGCRVPVVGRICMDSCMVDLSRLRDQPVGESTDLCHTHELQAGEASAPGCFRDPQVGDAVVLFGRQGDNGITIDEIAGWLGTINYEVVCLIGRRIPRSYWQNGQLRSVQNYLLGKPLP